MFTCVHLPVHGQIWQPHDAEGFCEIVTLLKFKHLIYYTVVVCSSVSYLSFLLFILDSPHLLVKNETDIDDVYLYPRLVETELNETSEGMLTVNCTSTGWPTPRIDWIVDISGNLTSIYDHPNYNVTENGQVSPWICMWCYAVQLKRVWLYTLIMHRFLSFCFQAWKR